MVFHPKTILDGKQILIIVSELSELVAANDGRSGHLSCLHAFLTYIFDVLEFFMIKLTSLLVQSNAYQVDTVFGKVFFFYMYMSVSV